MSMELLLCLLGRLALVAQGLGGGQHQHHHGDGQEDGADGRGQEGPEAALGANHAPAVVHLRQRSQDEAQDEGRGRNSQFHHIPRFLRASKFCLELILQKSVCRKMEE